MGKKEIEELIDICRREANLIDRLYCIISQHGLTDCTGDDFEEEVYFIANKLESIEGGLK